MGWVFLGVSEITGVCGFGLEAFMLDAVVLEWMVWSFEDLELMGIFSGESLRGFLYFGCKNSILLVSTRWLWGFCGLS